MKPVIFIVGPTASGKTDLSLRIAARLEGEVISADSMQVYKGLTIGTAKVDHALYPAIPHHMIDILSPVEEFSVYTFRERALSLIKDIHARAKIPFVVGGSGLYVKALTDGIADHPGIDVTFREQLKSEIKKGGLSQAYERLRMVDPAAAVAINKNDERRIIRALEIYECSGTTVSEWRKRTVSLENEGYDFLLLGITRDRAQLYKRVDERVDRMMAQGLLDEVKTLDLHKLSKTTKQAVGYKELIAHLKGECSLDDAVDRIKLNTHHLVKKQLTWFRKEKRITWFLLHDDDGHDAVTDEIVRTIKEWMQRNA
jgi:tRNA dimethylallyltransferase